MKLPKEIYNKREHGDGIAIAKKYNIPKSSVSDVFQLGEGNTKIVKAIIQFYNEKYNGSNSTRN